MEDKVQKELKDAINKKLVEIDVFFDDELAKYIMVLIANKKSREQIEEDLSLFLGKHTREFSNWLHDLLGQQSKEHDSSSVANGISQKQSRKNIVQNNSDDEDILALDAQIDDLLSSELQDDLPKSTVKVEDVSNDIQERQNLQGVKQRKDAEHSTVKHQVIPPVSPPRSSDNYPRSKSERPRYAVEKAVKRFKREFKEENEEEEYDPCNPSLKSVVRRKAQDVQPNKLLILKAVEEANRSIVGKENIDEVYKPTPIKVLISAARKKSHYRDTRPEDEQPTFDVVPEISKETDRKRSHKQVEGVMEKVGSSVRRRNLLQINTEPMHEPDSSPVVTEPKPRLVRYSKFHPEDAVQSEEDSADDEMEVEEPEQTHFVVTLDGFDANTLKRKRDMTPELDNMSEGDEEEEDETTSRFQSQIQHAQDMETSKLGKMIEKCRFWPSCKNGESCMYYHPTIPCNMFPNCKFGDKCFYIHPNCKFDAVCGKVDCPYTHLSRRVTAFIQARPVKVSQPPVAVSSYQMPVCKFHPYCSSSSCFYFHPKKCRFGLKCMAGNCPFIHPCFPSRHQLKWEAMSAFPK